MTKTKRLVGTRIRIGHYQEADQLLRRHGPTRRLRTLDSLQLAVALDLHHKKAIDRVVTSDKDLLAVAAAEGLAIFDPENP